MDNSTLPMLLLNTTSAATRPRRPDYCQLPMNLMNNVSFACLIVFIPITVIGNLLVVAVICSSKSLKKQTTFMFLASLAVADTLVGMISLPFNARMQWHGGFLCLGQALCWVYTLEEIFLSVSSVIHLFVIGIDRYLSLRYVYQYNILVTRKRVFAAIASIWCFSALIASLVIFKWKEPSKIAIVTNPSYICAADNTLYFTVVYVGCFIVPLIIMLYTYSYVYRTALHHILEIARSEVSFGSDSKKSREKKRKKRQFRTLRSIVIVFVVYCICWYPTIFYILSIFHAKDFWKQHRNEGWWKIWHFMLINFLPPLNSTTNPFIYVLCNKQFRKVCRQLYCKVTNQDNKSFATYMTTYGVDMPTTNNTSTTCTNVLKDLKNTAMVNTSKSKNHDNVML